MVRWDDITDPDTYEQFITIVNSALDNSYQFGTPSNEGTVDNTKTHRYAINSPSPHDIVYNLSATIGNIATTLQIVSSDFTDKKVTKIIKKYVRNQ